MIALSDPESFSVAPVRRPPADQLKVEQKCIKSKGKKSSVCRIVSYDSYLNAKRDARRIYSQTVQVPETRDQTHQCGIRRRW
jgi:hypothetical protein